MILLFYRGTKKEDPIEQPEFWEDFPDEICGTSTSKSLSQSHVRDPPSCKN